MFATTRRWLPRRRFLNAVLAALVLLLLAACDAQEETGEDAAATGAETEAQAGENDSSAEGDAADAESTDAQSSDGQAENGEREADDAQAEADSPYNIWRGERIVFTKEDGADQTLSENQDRITDNVWITRRNDGGQIFNIQERDEPLAAVSPIGTRWAIGTTDDIENLDFKPFRPAVGSPKEVPGKDVVLHLVEEDIYVDVRFLSWSQEKRGGFSYERTTPE
ncbi:MAG: hypothetical protein ACLFO1_08785 [Spirochaetaceae bacterium]